MKDIKQKIHPLHLVNGIEEGTQICQYMDLDYLLLMLERKKYHVKHKCFFDDTSERDFPTNKVIPLSAVGDNIPVQHETYTDVCLKTWQNIQREKTAPAACWTYNTAERLLIWKFFSSKYGVCIKSSVHDVVASIKESNYDIWCGKMTYNGYDAQKGFMENMFSKRSVFQEEEECRFYFFGDEKSVSDKPYIEIDIEPLIMINEIVLSPYIERKAAGSLAKMIQTEYNIKVYPSNI